MWKRLFKGKSQIGTKIRTIDKRQSDSALIWEAYSEGFNRKRVFLEILFPAFLAFLSLLITFLSYTTLTEISTDIKENNSEFFTIIAILIGFNITSLALISAFNRETLSGVFSKVSDSKKEQAFKQLLASFIYCVFIQTGIIVLGFFYNVNIENLYNIHFLQEINTTFKKNIVLILYPFWMWVLFHSFMVSIRNIVLLYKFIMVIFRG